MHPVSISAEEGTNTNLRNRKLGEQQLSSGEPSTLVCSEKQLGGVFPVLSASSKAFEPISSQSTLSWPACKFPTTSEDFEVFSSQTTAS